MADYERMVVAGCDFSQFSRSFTAAIQAAPTEIAERLRKIRVSYFGAYGLDGMYQRLNGRAVAEILTQCQPADSEPIASGEVDGVRWELFERPSGPEQQ